MTNKKELNDSLKYFYKNVKPGMKYLKEFKCGKLDLCICEKVLGKTQIMCDIIKNLKHCNGIEGCGCNNIKKIEFIARMILIEKI